MVFRCRHLFAVAASITIVTSTMQVPAFSQAGSSGGTIGKTDKSITGISDDIQPERKKGSRSLTHSVPHKTGLAVISATYGGNCGAPPGNVTQHLARACNGKGQCDYVVDYQIIGDPKLMCSKDYVAKWRCGDGRLRNASVPPEAGFGKLVSLSCE